MGRTDRLAIARMAIRILEPRLRSEGKFHAAAPKMPKHYELEIERFSLILGEGILILTNDTALSSVLNVWEHNQGKVLCVSWHPERPWQPPHISSLKPGRWIDDLHIRPSQKI
jgi:hypothetical protein